MRLVRSAVIVAALLAAASPWARSAEYIIETHSPRSWSAYYLLIGLGMVDPRPMSTGETAALVAHCRTLTELTPYDWIPLGYSIELGYKLCYRTGPFSDSDAKIFCDRLEMNVAENSRLVIVCESSSGINPVPQFPRDLPSAPPARQPSIDG